MPDHQNPSDALIAEVLARFPGAEIVYSGPAADAPRTEPKTAPYEYFSGFHDTCHAYWTAGFGVFPQSRGERRRPSPCVRELKHLRTTTPTPRERADWLGWTATRGVTEQPNAALVIPDKMLVIDIDVSDLRSRDIEALAVRHLGKTRLVRWARGSMKRQLFYATDSSTEDRKSSAHSLLNREMERLKDEDGSPLGYAVEILMPGKVTTVEGRHWKTGEPFLWNSRPHAVPREEWPVVTSDMLDAFLDAVEAEVAPLANRRAGESFNVRAAAGAVSPVSVDASGIVVPGHREGVEDVTYEGGKVVDHRDTYILRRSSAYVRCNHAIALTEAGRHAIAGVLLQECKQMFAGIGSKFAGWEGHDNTVLAECRRKTETGLWLVNRTPEFAVRLGREENGTVHTAVRTAVTVDRGQGEDALRWVETSQISLKAIVVADQDSKRRERALVLDPAERAKGQQAVHDAVRGLATTWLDEVRRHIMDPDLGVPPIRVGRFPTGAGKTSTLVEILGEGVPGPILFLLPSYANIDEVLARHRAGRKARPDLETTTFKAAAKEAVADAKRLGLNVQVMTGKEKGGCLMAEHLKLCRAHQAPSMGICFKDVTKVGDEKPTRVFCRHHPDHEVHADSPGTVEVCPVILARRELLKAQVIFAPTAFLTQTLPEGLKDRIKGLIVDERCLFELLRFDHFPADVLLQARPLPIITDKDRAKGAKDGHDLLRDRDEIAAVAHQALTDRRDVAAAVLAYRRQIGPKVLNKAVTGPELLDAAIAVAGRAQNIAKAIRPNMAMEELQALLSGPKAEHLRQEHRFWSLVQERVTFLQMDATSAGLNGGTPTMRMARGDRDTRIQALDPGIVPGTKTMQVRVSWIDDPTLDEIPTLLLDASADGALIGKAFRGRDVVMTDVTAYLHLRVVACLDGAWGTGRFAPGEHASDETKEACARNVVMANAAVTNVATIYGQGRIATFTSMRTREALQTGHAEPANTDFGHYGALKGLDFAKLHSAVVTIGRHEFPSWIYDALAAACSHNDEDPESAFDPRGTGLDLDEKPLRVPVVTRTYHLRDGRDLQIGVTEMPGTWGRRIQNQFREEELRQAAGRLRPVYRDQVGTWVAISSCLPEGTIIDAVTTLKGLADMKGAGPVFEAVRRVGVADPDLVHAQARDALPKGRFAHKTMERMGLLGGDLTGPFSEGFDAYVVDVDGGQRTVQVPAYHGEHAHDEMVEAYDRSDLSVRGIRRIGEGGLKIPSQARAPDRVDLALGSRDERFAEERALRDEARAHAEPSFVDSTFAFTRENWDRDKVNVDRAMVLSRQMGCDGKAAARLGGSAPKPHESDEEITVPEDASAAGSDTPATRCSPLRDESPPDEVPGVPPFVPAVPPRPRVLALLGRRYE